MHRNSWCWITADRIKHFLQIVHHQRFNVRFSMLTQFGWFPPRELLHFRREIVGVQDVFSKLWLFPSEICCSTSISLYFHQRTFYTGSHPHVSTCLWCHCIFMNTCMTRVTLDGVWANSFATNYTPSVVHFLMNCMSSIMTIASNRSSLNNPLQDLHHNVPAIWCLGMSHIPQHDLYPCRV